MGVMSESRELIKVAVVALGSWGDVEPYLCLYEHLRGSVRATFFVDKRYVELVGERGFEAVELISLASWVDNDPTILELTGMDFVDEWCKYLYEPSRVGSMLSVIREAHGREGFDMMASASNGEFLMLLLESEIPRSLRTDVLELCPNSETNPFIDVTYVPSVLMPLVWRVFYGEIHRIGYANGLAECFRRFEKAPETPDDMYRRILSRPALVGNDQAYARTKSPLFCPDPIVLTPRWRPVGGADDDDESVDAAERALRSRVRAFVSRFDTVGLICFGSMIVTESFTERICDWITSRLDQDPDFVVVFQGGIAAAGANLVYDALPADHPRLFKFNGMVGHDFLFRHVSWLLCHGGSGTTQQARRARVPTLVAPFVADQEVTMNELVAQGLTPRLPTTATILPADLDAALDDLLQTKRDNWTALPADTPTPDYRQIGALFRSVVDAPLPDNRPLDQDHAMPLCGACT